MTLKFNENKQPYIDLGQDFKISLNYGKVEDEKELSKAKDDIRETPEIREEALKELKELIKNEKNLVYPTEDFFLFPYLRPCKFYANSAFKKLKKDLKFKSKHKDIFGNLTVESVSNVFEDGIFKYTPLRKKDGQRVLYIQIGNNWNVERNSKHDLFRGIEIFLQAVAAEPITQMNGVCIILDMEGLSMNHVTQISPAYAATIFKWAQECLPIRLKKAYVVNNSKLFNIFWAIFTPFISAKLKKRVQFINQDFETLGELMGKDCLTKDYDGDLPVDYASGKVLVDFLKLHEKIFELKNISGLFDEKDDIEEKRKAMNACAQEVLNLMKTSST